MTYGRTMRSIRKQKGVTLNTLADGVCSVSFLSKFERGDSDISLGIMTSLLEKLMVSFDEFLFIHNDHAPDHLQHFFHTAYSLYLERDSKGLKELKKAQLDKWEEFGIDTFHHNALLLEVYESIVDEKPISEDKHKKNVKTLSDYLFGVEVWGYYELSLYNSTLLLLEPEMVMTLSKTAYIKSGRFKEFEKVNQLIMSVLINTVIYLIGPVNQFGRECSYTRELKEFISYLEEAAIPEQRLSEKLHLLQMKGLYEIRIGKKEEGHSKVERSIQMLDDLDSPKTAENIRQYLKQIEY
ncbi:DNA-binding protein [Jeotgalibacillus alimentarius]|uniref:DNA-binding protein n=1 Tax=Jeotgalibacillus alimentarius TaxID=135826 RepID=A0A0C2WC96_9BACL|nr:Rgg/GadR/MutR family transcriptional regulator [Jeotgalibacillus alimentarius]KIL53658.1 DNA-binding protein [Jeotgalibacillus alimentarius]